MTVCAPLPPLSQARMRQAIEDGRVMDSKQAAEWLGVNPITIRTLVAKGRLRTVIPGHKPLLFLTDDVHRCDDIRAGLA